MLLRLCISLALLFSCGYAGILLSKKFQSRVVQLDELQNALTQLEFDVDYLCIPLGKSFEKIANNTESELKHVFLYISKRLQDNPGCDMYRLWKRAFSKYSVDIALKDEDIDTVTEFSKMLGSGNREKEKNNIKITQMRLKILQDNARCDAEKNIKMYRGLGFLAGSFLVIVLL